MDQRVDQKVDHLRDQEDQGGLQVDRWVDRQDNQDRVLEFGRNQDIDVVEVHPDAVGHLDVEDPFGLEAAACTVRSQVG